MGDAETGISRADSVSGKLNWADAAPTYCGLQQQWVSRYFRAGGLAMGSRRGCQHFGQHFPQTLSQAAYPLSRESCVRGADRAGVDKRFRPVLVGCGQQAAAVSTNRAVSHGPLWCHMGPSQPVRANSGLHRPMPVASACAPAEPYRHAGPCADPQPRSPAAAKSKLYNPRHPERTVL